MKAEGINILMIFITFCCQAKYFKFISLKMIAVSIFQCKRTMNNNE